MPPPRRVSRLRRVSRPAQARLEGKSHMDKAEIATTLQQSGLQQLGPALDKLMLTSIRLITNPSFERAIQPGQSKLGGMPDLPAGTTWPAFKGAPMEFVAQMQLADAHAFDTAGLLPAQGLLSFFYDSSQQTFGSDPNDRAGFKVAYFEQPATALQRVDLPPSLPAEGRARVCSISMRDEVTLPLQPNLEIASLAWSAADQQHYDDALQQLTSAEKHPIHRLLGHPDTIQDDMRLECQLAANGVADPNADSCARGAVDTRRERLDTVAPGRFRPEHWHAMGECGYAVFLDSSRRPGAAALRERMGRLAVRMNLRGWLRA